MKFNPREERNLMPPSQDRHLPQIQSYQFQGSFKTEAGEVDFQIFIDENGTKFFFEQILNTPDKSSDDEGNPLRSKDEEQKE